MFVEYVFNRWKALSCYPTKHWNLINEFQFHNVGELKINKENTDPWDRDKRLNLYCTTTCEDTYTYYLLNYPKYEVHFEFRVHSQNFAYST